MNILRIKHKLIAYHWRFNHRNITTIAICKCGWKPRWFKRSWHHRWDKLKNGCYFRGHSWGEHWNAHTGPVNFVESEDTYLGTSRQCVRCYHCEDVEGLTWEEAKQYEYGDETGIDRE